MRRPTKPERLARQPVVWTPPAPIVRQEVSPLIVDLNNAHCWMLEYLRAGRGSGPQCIKAAVDAGHNWYLCKALMDADPAFAPYRFPVGRPRRK
jgi:hypothetical protein